MAKNYYDLLGLTRQASSDEIKKSYRKLVRKYHPDVSKEADAAEKMQQLNVAYETLTDESKRQEYDQSLDNPFGGQGAGNQYQYYRGNDSHAQQLSEEELRRAFAEQFAGRGQGSFSAGGFEDLFGQFGAGFAGRPHRQASGRGDDQHASLEVDVAVAYTGATRQLTLQLPLINAQGQPEIQRKTLQVKIPKGMKAGQQIRLSGQGQAGYQGGQNGDLYIEIHYATTDSVRVEGADVYVNVPVTPWEAALGQTIQVATPAGTVDVKLPENTQTGKQLRLKGKGIPAAQPGNLYLTLQVVLPAASDEHAKNLYRQMAEQLAFNPRQ